MKKILVIGGTGVMGTFLVDELLERGYRVDSIAIDENTRVHVNLRHFVGNAFDNEFLYKIVDGGYDGIVDFMTYSTEQFAERYEKLLKNTNHFIYLSSYRVYDNSNKCMDEWSKQLLYSSTDAEFLKTDDYALAKCRQEKILKESSYKNWSIIRPSITYSRKRLQLVSLEADVFLRRSVEKKKIVLPIEAKTVEATMTFAGDVAKMIANLLFKKDALGECFNTATSEHNTWEAISNMYKDILGCEFLWVDKEDYLKIIDDTEYRYSTPKWQLDYDRLFQRKINNEKILKVTGMNQKDITPLRVGLREEVANYLESISWENESAIYSRMEKYCCKINKN